MEETQEPVFHQREKVLTESLDEAATIEVVHKSAEEFLFATQRSLAMRATQEVTVSLKKVLTVANDFVEHVAADDIVEKVQQELQESQTVEIVEKTSEECTQVTITLPQLLTPETGKLRSNGEQEMFAAEMSNVDDLLTFHINQECFVEDESIIINIAIQQLANSTSLLQLVEEMELVMPMVAGTETPSGDTVNVDKRKKLDKSVDSSVDVDESATQSRRETCLKPAKQMIQDLGTSAGSEYISVFQPPDIKTSETGALAEEDLKEVEDAPVVIIELLEDLQPFVTEPVIRELDEAESLFVEAEQKASVYISKTADAIDRMLIQETTEAPTEIRTTMSAVRKQTANVPMATEECDDGTARLDRHEIEPDSEFKAQQLVTRTSEIATAEMTRVMETLPISTEEMQISLEMSELYLDVGCIEVVDIVAERDITECNETVENEVRAVWTDIRGALLTTPIITEGEAQILPDMETENDRQDDSVIETLRPAMYENRSKQYVSGSEEIEIGMKKRETELIVTCSFEETTLGELFTGTFKDEEIMKPVIEEAGIQSVPIVFSSSAEHEIDLLVFQHVLDARELSGLTTDELSTAFSRSGDDIFREPTEVDVDHQNQKKCESHFVVATVQPYEVRSETESTPVAACNEASASALCAPETTCDSIVTVQLSREYVLDDNEISQIVFPTLPIVLDLASVDKAEVFDDTTHEMVDDDTVQFYKALETLPHLKTDSVTVEKMSVMTDAKCTVPEDVQPELFVPYSSSVIVHSNDACAHQIDVIEERLSENLTAECAVDSVHITEIHSSEQDEHTLCLNEELLCDNMTVVFPGDVESSNMPSYQPNSGVAVTEIVKLPEPSLLFGGILLTGAIERDELQKDSVKQFQAATIESTVIEMRLSDNGGTLALRPEKPECSEINYLEETRPESAAIDNEILQESVDKGDAVIHSLVRAACSSEAKTSVYDSETLPDRPKHIVCEENVRIAIDKNREFDEVDESEEDVMQLSIRQIHDGTLVHVVREQNICDTSDINTVLVEVDVYDDVDTSRPEAVMKQVASDLVDNVYSVDPENVLSASQESQVFDAVQTFGMLESVSMNRTTLSSQEFLGDMETLQFEASATGSFREISDIWTDIPSVKNESKMDTQAISCETNQLTEVDHEETYVCETANIKPAASELMAKPASLQSEKTYTPVPQSEDGVTFSVGLSWNVLLSDLLDDDSSKSVTFSGDVNREDNGPGDVEASVVLSHEKPMERQAVSDVKPAGSSAASKSSVVTRKVQRVSADGKVVEKVKSNEVPMSFGPACLTPYFFGGDMPSPPDFSPQSDDRLSSASSIKVYTDVVEGEPWTERRVEEVEETRPDGAKVTRKVVRIRKRRTTIKHIIIEGPEFQEMVLDEPDKLAVAAEASSTSIKGASNVEGDLQSYYVDKQLGPLASKRKQTSLQGDKDLAAGQLSVEADIAMRNEDFSCTRRLVETDRTQPVQFREKRDDRDAGSDDDVDKDTTPLAMPLLLELSHTRVTSQARLLEESRHCGESECFPLDFDRDTSSSVGEGPTLDNVESASSCGDFATGILRYSYT